MARLSRDVPSLSSPAQCWRRERRRRSCYGPISEVAARLIEVRSMGYSGLDLLTLSSSHFDPLAGLRPFAYRMTIPGIGPIISSAVVAAIGNGTAFTRGRDFAAWLGLVPKQISTGDRTILGRITKRGNRYLRMLFMQAARVVLLRPRNRMKQASAPSLNRPGLNTGHKVRLAAAYISLRWPGLRRCK